MRLAGLEKNGTSRKTDCLIRRMLHEQFERYSGWIFVTCLMLIQDPICFASGLTSEVEPSSETSSLNFARQARISWIRPTPEGPNVKSRIGI